MAYDLARRALIEQRLQHCRLKLLISAHMIAAAFGLGELELVPLLTIGVKAAYVFGLTLSDERLAGDMDDDFTNGAFLFVATVAMIRAALGAPEPVPGRGGPGSLNQPLERLWSQLDAVFGWHRT